MLDALRVPLALEQTGAYQEALARLERDWFATLLEALREGRIGMVKRGNGLTGCRPELILI